ncbi:asparagine synthase-related protein [Amycolatopsis nigrescens]|uniref:asparagine synthase-related protein n=1 Tax=Amycolatopsis nigrescens TaxID=381445 RepID=UPI00037BC4DB|nr:asparagine synthase-related protein [Amycolatopsis nigrescens]
MTGKPSTREEAWFVALPDHPGAAAASETLASLATCTVAHPSGRPWLAGNWADDELTVAGAGRTKLAVFGCCPATEVELTAMAAKARTVADLDRPAGTMAGSFHLLSTVDGELRVQGSASGLRRVCTTRLNGVAVAADRADLLATLTGAGLDERLLGIRLLTCPPYPLDDLSPWQSVEIVPDGSYFAIGRDGRARTVRWWHPPEPVESLADGATALRDALTAAVHARTRHGGTVTCDLSGGLDSTPLCFLAADSGAELVACTTVFRDQIGDDLAWADLAAKHLPGVERELIAVEDLPRPVEGLADIGVPLEQPFLNAFQTGLVTAMAERLAARGSRVHLTGHGGDEVVQGWPGFLHTLARGKPLLAGQYLRAYRALFHWPRSVVLRELADRRCYRQWLADSARELHGAPISAAFPPLGWEIPGRLPDWASQDAVRTVGGLISGAAETAEPLAPTRGQHGTLVSIRNSARAHRMLRRVLAGSGVRYEAPYLDDRVLEACLSVREHERTTPWRFKPLTVAAMRGVLPDELLRRNTKGTPTVDEYQGYRRNRADVLALWEDSRLVRLGLVDAGRIRAACTAPDPYDVRQTAVLDTAAVELWLRAVQKRPEKATT